VDHIVIPIGQDHRKAIHALRTAAGAAAGVECANGERDPHVSLIAYEGLSRAVAEAAIEMSLRATEPFVIHAHGYGFFTGDHPANLTLHVPVVRAEALNSLHARLHVQLREAGADIAPWSAPDLWTPHLTLLDRALDPPALGAAAAWLARRHHPSWSIPVDRVVLTGGWPDRTGLVIPLGAL
jgi:2'-5' RNA ligase